MTLQLQLRSTNSVPIEVEGITPDAIRTKSKSEIEKLPAFFGNQETPLAELFDVSGDASDQRITFQGDCRGVHWIGAKMKDGFIHVEGDAGRHVGSELAGGTIQVDGDASDWVGGEMKGGKIRVGGRAGHLVGAAYRGSPSGMTGGSIYVRGACGNEIGHTMRRGTIVIGGDIGDLAGFNMRAGTVLSFGKSGIRHGAGMKRGTIGLLGSAPESILPTFRYACLLRPLALQMIMRTAVQEGIQISEDVIESEFALYHGDFLEGGRGEILTVPA